MKEGRILTIRVDVRKPEKTEWLLGLKGKDIEQTGLEVRALTNGDLFMRDDIKEWAIKKILDRDLLKVDFTKPSHRQDVNFNKEYEEYENEEELLRDALKACEKFWGNE
jgi:hypothetical protein